MTDSNEEIIFGETNELDRLTEMFQDIILKMSEKIDQRLSEIDKVIENLEKQLATLIVGYGEQAIFMEALIGQIAFASPDAQKAFSETLAKSRKEMLQIMKDGSNAFLGPENQNLSSAVENLVDQKLADTSEE